VKAQAGTTKGKEFLISQRKGRRKSEQPKAKDQKSDQLEVEKEQS